MRKNVLLVSMLFIAGLMVVSCKKKSNDPEPTQDQPAATYDGSDYLNNASVELALRTNLDAVSAELRKGNSGGTVNATTLRYEYTKGGSNSVSNQTVSAFRSLVDAYFDEAVSASGGATWTPSATPTGNGGRYGAYYFDEYGVEILQVVEKGSFTATFYNRLLSLSAADFSTAEHAGKVDGMVALYGAHPLFKNSNAAKHGAYADKYSAGYAARRDKNDGNGLYTKVRDNFIKLQGAIKAGNTTDRDEALGNVKANWEKGIMATVVNYSNAAASNLSKTSPTEAEFAAALHALSENAGFIGGWASVPSAHRIISDAEAVELLGYINFTMTGNPTLYTFVTDRENQVAKLGTLRTRIQQIYGFTDAEMADFNANQVGDR